MTMQKSKIFPQIFAAGTSTLILINVGFHIGWASPSLAKLQAKDSDLPITSDQGVWIVNFLMIGTFCGSIFAFTTVDKWGRKTLLLIISVPLFLSCLLIALAKSFFVLCLARFIAGFGNGISFTCVPMYTSEVAEDKIRGGLGILITVMVNTGCLIAFTIGPWASRAALAGIGAVIPILYGAIMIWLPESPYYYSMRRINDKTEKSLKWLRGTADVGEEANKIHKHITMSRERAGTVKQLFTVKGNQKALLIMLGLTTCQQCSGFGAIFVYSTMIFDEVNAGLDSSVIVIITGIVGLIGAILVVFLADLAGRRPLLLISMSLCTFFLFLGGAYFHLQNEGIDVKIISWLPVVAIIGYLLSFTVGMGTIPILLVAEIFPCEVKALAMTGGTGYLCATAICIIKLYQMITDTYHVYMSFYFFAICSGLAIVFIYFVVPETKKRSFNEIQDELHGVSKPMLMQTLDSVKV